MIYAADGKERARLASLDSVLHFCLGTTQYFHLGSCYFQKHSKVALILAGYSDDLDVAVPEHYQPRREFREIGVL